MPAKAFCRVCDVDHVRPVGRKCRRRRAQVGDVSANPLDASGPANSDQVEQGASANLSNEVSNAILTQLTSISARLDSMDERVRSNETALADKSAERATVPVPGAANASSALGVSQPSSSNPTPLSNNDAIVPSVAQLNADSALQRQVEQRMLELHQKNELALPGKMISQRGGGNIPIKRSVPWPQNYVLVGPNKKRPSYDTLNPMEWTSGIIKAALDLPNPQRDQKLEYVSSLLEDAADFSFESAKACHAVVLTTMENDRLDWKDTDRLDRLRRCHAQRHMNENSNSAAASNKHVKSVNSGFNRTANCRFFQSNKCGQEKSHITNGTFYQHLCEKCGGGHTTRSCISKQAKN